MSDAMDRLITNNRIKGASRMIAEGTAARDVTEEHATAVIEQIKAYRESSGRSANSIAKSIGYSPSVVSQVLDRKYAGNWREVIIDLDRWLEDQQRIDSAPSAGEFVWTEVAKEIEAIANSVVALRTIGLVYGPTTSGIGKTMTLRALTAEKPGSILVTIDKVSAGANGLLQSICSAMRIGSSPNLMATFNRIVQMLRGTSRLLMIDQIHNLCGQKDDRPFFVLADLYDRTNSPQLWCGTTDIVEYFDRGQGKGRETLAQIRRRVAVSRDLLQRTRPHGRHPGQPLYSIDEIRKIFSRDKMRLAPDAARYLCRLANIADSGALGTCRNIVLMAAMMNKEMVLNEAHLKAAHKFLVNNRSFENLERDIADEFAAPTAKAG